MKEKRKRNDQDDDHKPMFGLLMGKRKRPTLYLSKSKYKQRPSSTLPHTIEARAASEATSSETSAVLSPVIVDDESDKEEEDALITNSPDLTAKEIRALVAICCALCQAPEYPDGVTSQDIKQKLYHDKQESIPAHCLDTGARLINAVRRITPKKDQNFLMASWCQMRTLRNILVVFAGRRTKRNPVKLTIVKQKDNDDQHAVRIDSGALYHLFSSDYDLYQSNGADKFTSVSVVKTEEQKLNLFNNFFRSKEADKQAVKTLNDEIKASRQTYTALAKQLKQLELARMAPGNKSSVFERKHKRRDPRLYGDLVAARKAFNNVHKEQSNLLHVIQERHSRMYLLNKKVNGQSAPSKGRLTDANIRHIVAEPTTIIQGIVTVASGMATSPASLFSAVNRFQAISDEAMVPHPRDKEHRFSLTVSKVNTAVMSNQDDRKVKRRCRLKKYHQRKVVSDKALNCQPKGSFTVTFTGNWSGSGAYIKGHSCRSTKPYYKQLAASYHDSVVSVDEHKSTVTCSSCFGRTSK
ncbi:hypothetical protein G6F42_014112 [Rhizopus arrhizus]|nr:hypothetical protein G6F42_014112 [Rhizopus arrhizus]